MQNKTSFNIVIGVLLFLSVTLNVFLGGIVAGSRNGGDAVQRIEKLATTLSAFRELSPASREKAKEIVRRDWPAIKQRLADLRDKRKEVKDLLGQPDYSRETLEKKFAELRAMTAEAQARGQAMAADIAGAVTPEERMKLATSGSWKP
jgi:uncharacterized membrane protein